MGRSHVEIETRDHVGTVSLNRPEKYNALSEDMWSDLPDAVRELSADANVRVIVLAGRGPAFTVGIDLNMLTSLAGEGESHADRSVEVYRQVTRLQRTMSVFAEAPQPVIAAIHGYCLGAGIDMITACDIRLAAADAVFGVRETRMGLIADVGTMQRLPGIIAPGHVAELVFGGADIDAARAERIGLVNRVYDDLDQLTRGAYELAGRIAANSPLVVQGAKAVLRVQADMSVTSALDHMALWNAAFLHSNDLSEAIRSHGENRPPDFTGT